MRGLSATTEELEVDVSSAVSPQGAGVISTVASVHSTKSDRPPVVPLARRWHFDLPIRNLKRNAESSNSRRSSSYFAVHSFALISRSLVVSVPFQNLGASGAVAVISRDSQNLPSAPLCCGVYCTVSSTPCTSLPQCTGSVTANSELSGCT
jgi:hypothetical protein